MLRRAAQLGMPIGWSAPSMTATWLTAKASACRLKQSVCRWVRSVSSWRDAASIRRGRCASRYGPSASCCLTASAARSRRPALWRGREVQPPVESNRRSGAYLPTAAWKRWPRPGTLCINCFNAAKWEFNESNSSKRASGIELRTQKKFLRRTST